MPFLILLLFIGLPIAEIAVLIKVADAIDLWPTILLIVLTAIIGVYLLRLQGLSSLQRAQTSLNEGKLPVGGITDAVGLMLAGAFLLTPGLITDTLGFALLVPAIRHGIARYLFNKARASSDIKVDIFGMKSSRRRGGRPSEPEHPTGQRQDGPIIEGEIIEPQDPKSLEDEDDRSSNGSSHESSPWNK